ncbi:MAG: Crp/Fnr family transcriptional regulator [Bacillota bacterium]|nr:Crp/Fnr family transcriptional regulator [Bacillota bacterium]
MKSFLDDFTLPTYNSRVFHHVPHWEKIAKLGDSIFLPENHYLVSPGDKVEYCYLLKEGRIITLEITQDGEMHIFNIFEAGSLLLESNLLADYESNIFCQTTMPTELVRIGAEPLKEGIRNDPDIMQAVFESFASKYYSAMDQLKENYNHDAMWKIYNMLMLLSQNMGKPFSDEWVMIDMKITQQFICNMLGLNRITVSRALKEMREKDMLMTVNSNYCVRKPQYKTDES